MAIRINKIKIMILKVKIKVMLCKMTVNNNLGIMEIKNNYLMKANNNMDRNIFKTKVS
jgi:hypothetical protein